MKKTFADIIYNQMSQNPKIILIYVDVGYDALEKVIKEFPQRCFNAGAAEANAINIASGLAKCGYIPVVYGIASFLLRRAYEQIKLYLGLQRLPVILVGNGGGLGYGIMGESHHILEDIALTQSAEIISFTPVGHEDFRQSLNWIFENPTACYFRLINDLRPMPSCDSDGVHIEDNFKTKTIISLGNVCNSLPLDLSQYNHLRIGRIPFTLSKITIEMIQRSHHIVIIEEHQGLGGLGSYCYPLLQKTHPSCRIEHRFISSKLISSCQNREKILMSQLVPSCESERSLDCI